jgi:hypothetical protein
MKDFARSQSKFFLLKFFFAVSAVSKNGERQRRKYPTNCINFFTNQKRNKGLDKVPNVTSNLWP